MFFLISLLLRLRISFFNNYLLIIGLLFCIILYSCDCGRNGSGIVVDYETNLPIDSVIVKSYINKVRDKSFESKMMTDSTGRFTGSTGLTAGSFNGCPNLVIECSKKGYVTQTITNPHDITVKLIKE